MILEVCGLSFRYNSNPIIRNASFKIKEGEILSVLGPNGAGKTTLLKSLNRILTPQKGTVIIDGNDTHNLRQGEIAKIIGWVPQQGEITRMKVYDLILLGRKPYFRWGPSREDHIYVEKAIRLMDIEALSMRYADEISGGEFQLVQIVRALAQTPRVIFFDEPTSSLDISNQHHLMSKISALIHSGSMAAVMTMHDINLALRYSDKFLLLKKGSVCAFGGKSIITPETIKSVYNMDAQIVEAGGYPLVIPV
jgi:iron complex transport system ATP-binding protein